MDAFSRVINNANETGRFISNFEHDSLNTIVREGKERIEVVSLIGANASEIVANAARALFAEQPSLIQPGGNAYTNKRMAACLRDLQIILRYVSYAIIAGDPSVLEDRCLNGLRETYQAIGVPGSSVAVAIQRLKEFTIKLIQNRAQGIQQSHDRLDLTLPEIRRRYPKQWITVEVTDFINGFPARGKILLRSKNIDNMIAKLSELDGNIYTFFSGRIDDVVETSEDDEVVDMRIYQAPKNFNLPAENSSLISELSSYFDRAAAAVA